MSTSNAHSSPKTHYHNLHDVQHSHKDWESSKKVMRWVGWLIVLFLAAAIVGIFVSMKVAGYGIWSSSSGGGGSGQPTLTALEPALVIAARGNPTNYSQNGIIIPQGWGKVFYPAMIEALNGVGPARISVFGGYSEAGYYASDVVTKVWPGALGSTLRSTTSYSDGGMGWIGIGNTEIPYVYGVSSIVTGWPNSATHAYFPGGPYDWSITNAVGYGPGSGFLHSNTTSGHIMPLVFTGSGRYVVIYYGADGYNESPFYVALGSVAMGVATTSLISPPPNLNNSYGLVFSAVVDAGQYFPSQIVTISAQQGTEIIISGVRFLTTFNLQTSAPNPNSGIVVDNYASGIAYRLSDWLDGSATVPASNNYWSGPIVTGPGQPFYSSLYYSSVGSHLSIVSMGFAESYCGNNMNTVESQYQQLTQRLQAVSGQDILLVFPFFDLQNPSLTGCSNGYYVTAEVISNYRSLITYAVQLAAANGYAVWDVSGLATNQSPLYTWANFNSLGYWGNASVYGAAGTTSPYLSDAGHAFMAEGVYNIVTGAYSGGVCC